MIAKKIIYPVIFIAVVLLVNACECVPDINAPKEIKPDQYANVQFVNCNSDFELLRFKTESDIFTINSYYLDKEYKYQSMIPGITNIKITDDSDSLLFNSILDLKKAYPYTFFAFGNINRVQGMLLPDTINNYISTNSYFRCINLANLSPYIMFKIIGTYSIPSIHPFKSYSAYFPTYSGIYNIEIRNATNDSLLLFEENIKFDPGRAYSLVLRGYYEGISRRNLNLKVIESDFLLNKQ